MRSAGRIDSPGLTILLNHQQILIELSKELVSGSITKNQWMHRVQVETDAVKNKVQHINF
jgi:hypothetical protein